ncbi:MAG: PAS domain-containing sensor histidine kinase, partial [Gammaproteobacteria bacterium]|nr:PAS domain-containing sensor histidine kinase [Gammaproteobacteria bacterium]
ENYSLYCNFNEIQSMVTYLITNAVRYTPEGGSITIKWKVDLLGGSLSVEDTGIGIEEENIPRLTERFYRTDSARSRAAGGTGLGLAIVNHIVNRHNAKLLIRSKVGKGSLFTVLFPRDSIRADHEQVKLLLN